MTTDNRRGRRGRAQRPQSAAAERAEENRREHFGRVSAASAVSFSGLRGFVQRPPRLRGQSLIECVAVLVIVVAALVAMAIYSKRGISGYLRGAAGAMGNQYAPKHTTSVFTSKAFSSTTTTSELVKERDLDGDGKMDPVMVTTSVINAADHDGDGDLEGDTTEWSGTETVGPLGTDLWER